MEFYNSAPPPPPPEFSQMYALYGDIKKFSIGLENSHFPAFSGRC